MVKVTFLSLFLHFPPFYLLSIASLPLIYGRNLNRDCFLINAINIDWMWWWGYQNLVETKLRVVTLLHFSKILEILSIITLLCHQSIKHLQKMYLFIFPWKREKPLSKQRQNRTEAVVKTWKLHWVWRVVFLLLFIFVFFSHFHSYTLLHTIYGALNPFSYCYCFVTLLWLSVV